MLSVGLCLSARLPAGLLVFFGFVGSFGSIDHRLQQFELLPCGAVQTVDFFDHIVGVGGCDPFSEFVPSLFRFGVETIERIYLGLGITLKDSFDSSYL